MEESRIVDPEALMRRTSKRSHTPGLTSRSHG
jgi:hypothetical protein